MSEVVAAAPTRNPLKRFYRWILSWAHHPAGTWALAVFAFIDSSFFPIPPLFLQVALSLEKPRRAWWYAFVNMSASVAGAVLGYVIGRFLYGTVGAWIIETTRTQAEFSELGQKVTDHAFGFILFSSFLPFPYKVITIGSGFFGVPLWILLVASTIGRSARFFSLAALCAFGGERVRTFIDKYFNWVCLGIAAFVVLILVLGKIVLKPQ